MRQESRVLKNYYGNGYDAIELMILCDDVYQLSIRPSDLDPGTLIGLNPNLLT